eukprot:1220925-Rhodomonas_salina.4
MVECHCRLHSSAVLHVHLIRGKRPELSQQLAQTIERLQLLGFFNSWRSSRKQERRVLLVSPLPTPKSALHRIRCWSKSEDLGDMKGCKRSVLVSWCWITWREPAIDKPKLCPEKTQSHGARPEEGRGVIGL